MIDREKIVNSLRNDVIACQAFDGSLSHYEISPILYEEVCNLLKDTEPVAPKREVIQLGQVLSCGCCGAWLIVTFQKFCHECGREVKWE